MSLAPLHIPTTTQPVSMAAARGWRAMALCGCLALAACGGSDETPTSFPPPDYSYLSKLRLNVGTLTVVDHVQQAGPEPGDISQDAPVPPDQALQRLAQDRLVAAGNSGSAVFTIDRASIVREPGGALDGHLAVHLDIITANGGHAGYAEGHVSRQLVPGDPGPSSGTRGQLYDLDRQMMQDMNVELEYQVRRSLRDWLVDAGGAPLAGSVEQQNLSPPGSPGYEAGPTPGSGPVGSTPVGTTPVGSTPVGTTPVGAMPVAPGPYDGGSSNAGPVVLAPPGGEAPTTFPPSTPGPAPVEAPPIAPDPAAAANPDPVFPDGVPPGNAVPPPAVIQRSPPPSYLQTPGDTSAAPGATPSGY